MVTSSDFIIPVFNPLTEPIDTYSPQEFKVGLKKVATGKTGSKDLTREEARRMLNTIMEGGAEEAQIGAFFAAMRIKSTVSEELMGFTDAIQQHSTLIKPKVDRLLNASGPYNGRARTPYLNLAGSFAACAAGVQVVTHSTDHLPPKWGVSMSETFDELGIRWDLPPSAVEELVERTGFGYLHEKNFSFGIEKLKKYRVALNFRTLLHTCELIANPAQANRMLIGIFHKPYYEMFIGTCQMNNVDHALILQGVEGSDEMPLKKCKAVEVIMGEPCDREYEPKKMGFEFWGDIQCSDAKTGAALILSALEKKQPHAYEGAVLNGGLRIYLAGGAASLKEGIDQARGAIDSGSARDKLEEFKKVSSGF
jgi:anthranilate phosphoribosyltransferase